MENGLDHLIDELFQGLGLDAENATVSEVLASNVVKEFTGNKETQTIKSVSSEYGVDFDEVSTAQIIRLTQEHPSFFKSIVSANFMDNLDKIIAQSKNWVNVVGQYNETYTAYTALEERIGVLDGHATLLSGVKSALELLRNIVQGRHDGAQSLAGQGIDDACMRLIADTVDFGLVGSLVTTLDLSNNDIGPNGLRSILDHLDEANEENTLSIEAIKVNGNKRFSDQDIESLKDEFPDILGRGLFGTPIEIILNGQ